MNTFAGIWIFFFAVSQVSASPKVNVTVFYESLCPDSARFIKKQLYPTYLVLQDHMNVEFVPFGKAHYTTNPWTISCQHGRHECLGNALQACALSRLQDSDKQMKFINCVMSEKQPLIAGKKCARRLKYSYAGVEECSMNEEGKQLMAQLGDRTRNFRERLNFVPTILFNDKYSERDQKDALRDLKSVVCRKIGSVPPQCTVKSLED